MKSLAFLELQVIHCAGLLAKENRESLSLCNVPRSWYCVYYLKRAHQPTGVCSQPISIGLAIVVALKKEAPATKHLSTQRYALCYCDRAYYCNLAVLIVLYPQTDGSLN